MTPLGSGPCPMSTGDRDGEPPAHDGPLVAEGRTLSAYLDACRGLVLEEIHRLVPVDGEQTGGLYRLMLEYPLRAAKALRPALCIATCRALGGALRAVLPSAAVLELYHNAFLIHDDVEDGSEKRRREETLHRSHGVPIAVNVGDGMLALGLTPLLENTELLGLGRALRILREIARMVRETAEGQMMELDWVRRGHWSPSDRAYLRMVYKKTAWYSFVTPVTVGAIAAGADQATIRAFARFAGLLGIAFQIQDDVLNLAGREETYGKEINGDLWEGKHTLILARALRNADLGDVVAARTILAKRRPGPETPSGPDAKTPADVRFLRDLIDRGRGVEDAWAIGRRHARRAARTLAEVAGGLPSSVHREFLSGLSEFVVRRDH